MSVDQKVFVTIVSLILAIVATCAVGCNLSEMQNCRSRERMAELGYEQVAVTLAGSEHPVYYWKKIE